MIHRIQPIPGRTSQRIPKSRPARQYAAISLTCVLITACGRVLSGGPLSFLLIPFVVAALIFTRAGLLLGVLVAAELWGSSQVTYFWPPAGLRGFGVVDAWVSPLSVLAILAACRYLSFEREIFVRGETQAAAVQSVESFSNREIALAVAIVAVGFVVCASWLWYMEALIGLSAWFALGPREFRTILFIGSMCVFVASTFVVLGYAKLKSAGRFDSRRRLYADIWSWCGQDLWRIGMRRKNSRP